MLPVESEDHLKLACDTLINYFCTTPDVLSQTKDLLLQIRPDFGGAEPSASRPRQTFAYLFAHKLDKTQLETIDYAIMRLDALAVHGKGQGLEPLKVILELLEKSRSKNWSAGQQIWNAMLISPSLNNRLTCALLTNAGLEISYAQILQDCGVEFCALLAQDIELKEQEIENSARGSSADLAGNSIHRVNSEDMPVHQDLPYLWTDGIETASAPTTQAQLLRLRGHTTTPVKNVLRNYMG